MENTDYLNFVRGKIAMAKFNGFEVDDADISPILKPHQRDIVKWAVRGGRVESGLFHGLGVLPEEHGAEGKQSETVRF